MQLNSMSTPGPTCDFASLTPVSCPSLPPPIPPYVCPGDHGSAAPSTATATSGVSLSRATRRLSDQINSTLRRMRGSEEADSSVGTVTSSGPAAAAAPGATPVAAAIAVGVITSPQPSTRMPPTFPTPTATGEGCVENIHVHMLRGMSAHATPPLPHTQLPCLCSPSRV